jgi:hypothetical protein
VSTAHAQALSLITLVCSILSIVGLTITIVTHSCYKNLRRTVPSRLLICLCLALLASLILFLIASHADLSGSSCQTVGVLMQFAWLCSMCWMVVQAVNLYAVIVVVLGLDMKKRVRLYHLFAWSEFFACPVPFLCAVCSLLTRPFDSCPCRHHGDHGRRCGARRLWRLRLVSCSALSFGFHNTILLTHYLQLLDQ